MGANPLRKVRSWFGTGPDLSPPEGAPIIDRIAALQQRAVARSYAEGFAAGVQETVNHLAGMGTEGNYDGPMPPELAAWIINAANRLRAVDPSKVADDVTSRRAKP